MPTKKEMIEQVQRDRLSLGPLSFRFLEYEPKAGESSRLDALIETSWMDKTVRFAVECRSLSTPKAFQDGLNYLKLLSLPKDWQPLLFLPFLSERQLERLELERISGIDLCGNGVVMAPGIFAVFRSGEKNRFPSSARIKNIYRKNSSMVGRVFLVRPFYGAVQEICSEINRRNVLVTRWNKKAMSLSTVSKTLKTLEEDLIIERGEVIHLLQVDKLLKKLCENYVPPKINERIRLKVPEGSITLLELLARQSQDLGLPLVASGTSSIGRYAVMQRGDMLSLYCPSVEILLEQLPGDPSNRFPNLELIDTEDETVYFDCRELENFWWSSPVQAYLELMAGDKRDQEAADQLKVYITKNSQAVHP